MHGCAVLARYIEPPLFATAQTCVANISPKPGQNCLFSEQSAGGHLQDFRLPGFTTCQMPPWHARPPSSLCNVAKQGRQIEQQQGAIERVRAFRHKETTGGRNPAVTRLARRAKDRGRLPFASTSPKATVLARKRPESERGSKVRARPWPRESSDGAALRRDLYGLRDANNRCGSASLPSFPPPYEASTGHSLLEAPGGTHGGLGACTNR